MDKQKTILSILLILGASLLPCTHGAEAIATQKKLKQKQINVIYLFIQIKEGCKPVSKIPIKVNPTDTLANLQQAILQQEFSKTNNKKKVRLFDTKKKREVLIFKSPPGPNNQLKGNPTLSSLGLNNHDILYAIILLDNSDQTTTIFAKFQESNAIHMVTFSRKDYQFVNNYAYLALKELIIKKFQEKSNKNYNYIHYDILSSKGVGDLKNGDLVYLWRKKNAITSIVLSIHHIDSQHIKKIKLTNINHISQVIDTIKILTNWKIDGTIPRKNSPYTPLNHLDRLDTLKIQDQDTLYVREPKPQKIIMKERVNKNENQKEVKESEDSQKSVSFIE
ncbi:MAG: hypothetical protein AAF770_01765 [Bacteroidota bacterium]